MESIEWAHVPSEAAVLYGPYDLLPDGQCAAEDGGPQDMALAVGNCAIRGTKADLQGFLEEAAQAVAEFDFPEDPMREALERAVTGIVSNLETQLQREEAQAHYDGQTAIIIVPGEEGLYPGKLITVDIDGSVMEADIGNWGIVR